MCIRDSSYIVEGNVVRIVPLTVLDAENLARQKLADSQAPTSIETRAYTLNYARAEELEPLLKVAVLSKFGNVQHDKRTNTLIVRDLPDRLVATADLIATLDKAEPQVEIEARIVQTNRDSARALGVQWGGGGRVDPQIGNTTGLNFPNSGSIVAGTDLSAPSPTTTPSPRPRGRPHPPRPPPGCSPARAAPPPPRPRRGRGRVAPRPAPALRRARSACARAAAAGAGAPRQAQPGPPPRRVDRPGPGSRRSRPGSM